MDNINLWKRNPNKDIINSDLIKENIIMCKMIHSLRFFLWKKDRSDWLDSFKYFGLGADHIFSVS